MVTEEIYEAWLASPITPPSHTTAAPIDYDCFATAIAHGMVVPPNASVITTAVARAIPAPPTAADITTI